MIQTNTRGKNPKYGHTISLRICEFLHKSQHGEKRKPAKFCE